MRDAGTFRNFWAPKSEYLMLAVFRAGDAK
jgi:hypothetical protein